MPNCRVLQYSLCCSSCELYVNVKWCFTFFLVKKKILIQHCQASQSWETWDEGLWIRDASNRWVWLGNSEPAAWGVGKHKCICSCEWTMKTQGPNAKNMKIMEERGAVTLVDSIRPIRFSNFSLRWEGRVQNEGLCLRRWKGSCHAIYTEREKTTVVDPLDWWEPRRDISK